MDGKREMRRRRGITPELQQAAWRLRSEMTPAEEVLWEALRDRRLNGLRFRRQHPVGQFVLDFYCSLHKLVLEIDGSVHDTQSEQDAARTAHINAHGYRVIRFSNKEVLANLPDVLERIAAAVHLGPGGLSPPLLGAGGTRRPLTLLKKETTFDAEGTGC